MKDLYTKNYITLRKNVKETFINGKTSKVMDGKTVLRFSRKTEPTGRECVCVKKSCVHSFQYMWVKKFIITNWLLGFWKLRSSRSRHQHDHVLIRTIHLIHNWSILCSHLEEGLWCLWTLFYEAIIPLMRAPLSWLSSFRRPHLQIPSPLGG